ncbi:MAG TPA: hypothetical protein VFF21_04760 [Flavobacteriaceae bacterium]|nr:hypothetical protein [Flavobacteriaceae bacterium]
MTIKTKYIFWMMLVFFLFTVLPAEAQCAMCRAVLESEEGGDAAKGINNGIVYLMIFPYLLVGGVGYAIYRSRKKARKVGQV